VYCHTIAKEIDGDSLAVLREVIAKPTVCEHMEGLLQCYHVAAPTHIASNEPYSTSLSTKHKTY